MKFRYYHIAVFLLASAEGALAQIVPYDAARGYDYDISDWEPVPTITMSDSGSGVAQRTFCDEDGNLSRTTIEYFNGIGQPMESIRIGASPTSGDIVTLQEYDAFGRKNKSWLPAVMSSQGGYLHQRDNVRAAAVTSYAQDASPFSLTVYEQSPLNRATYQYGAGSDWHLNSKAVRTEHLANVYSNTELGCFKIVLSQSSGQVQVSGYYNTGTLQVTKTTSEDGEATLDFRDTQGRLILSRRLMSFGDASLDTYYVYDGYSNLRYVFPPKASALLSQGTVDSSILSQAYQYSYDSWNRMASKTLPGVSAVYMAYDPADRLVLSQDGNQRNRGVCTFRIYDAHGRECIMGECSNTIGTSGVATMGYARATYTGTGGYMGYSISGIVLSNPQILSVKYYDSYEFLNNDSLSYVNDTSFGLLHSYPRGLMTGEVSALLEDSISNYTYAAYYYDEHNQMIQSHKTNHLGGYEHEYTEYDFTGNILRHKKVHTAANRATITQVFSHTYDNEGRMLTTTHSINGRPAVTLANNEYDALGRISADNRNGTASMRTSYEYNVRSWLTSMSSSLFSESLCYNQASNDTQPRYGGDISSFSTTVLMDDTPETNGYRFSYDKASRLIQADYVGDGDWYSTSYGYDANSNITSLTRKGPDAAGALSYWDDLTMTYDGNKLQKVTDDAPTLNTYNSMQFVDGVDTATEFAYDQNGNLTKDSNRNISSVKYNVLNLPRKITIGNGYEKITYEINGIKLHTYTMPRTYAPDPVDTLPGPIGPAPLLHRLSIGNGFQLHATKDYCNGIVYSGNSVERVLVDGGYITFSNNNPIYHFYMTDHLGSNRMVISTTGDIEQINTYYPFGASRKDSENNGQTQTYKYTGKELEGGNLLYWYDYGARWYDAVLGRFTTMDPLCEEDYDVSPYVYCHNSPINRTDPDGNTDYELMANGLIKHREFDNNTNDRLFVHNSQQFISLRKGLLCQLLQQIDNILGHYATTNYADDAFKLFKFAADNSTVEWGLEKFSTKGKAYYSIHTSNNTSSLTTNYTNEEIANLQLILHSHPKYNGNDMASGDYEAYAKASGSMNSVYYPTSDLMTLNNIYNRFQKIHGTGYPVSKYPKAYIYNSKSSLLFKYTTEQSILNPIKITNYLQILRLVK